MAKHARTRSSADRWYRPVQSDQAHVWQVLLLCVVSVLTLLLETGAPEGLTAGYFVGVALVVLASIRVLVIDTGDGARLPRLVTPLVDVVAIGLMCFGGIAELGVLWVFPLAWVAASYRPAAIAMTIGLIAALQITRLATARLRGEPVLGAVDVMVAVSLVVFALASITVYLVVARARGLQQLLRSQSDRLDRTLAEVSAERRELGALAAGLPVAVARIGAEGRVEFANPACVDWYGLDPRDLNAPFLSVEHDEYRGAPLPSSETTLAWARAGRICAARQTWMLGVDHSWRVLHASVSALSTAGGAPDGHLLVAQDVTDAVRAQRASRELTLTVAHHQRNALMSVLGYTDLVLEEEVSPTTARYLESIRTGGERLLRLVEQVLAGSTGAFEAGVERATRVDVAAMVREVVDSYAPLIRERQLSAEVELPDALAGEVDVYGLRQLAVTMIGNAIAYDHPGGRLRVALRAEPGNIVLAVGDDGPGIADELLHQLDEDLDAPLGDVVADHTVRGVRLVQLLARAQRGSVEIDTAPGRGTVVTVRLPAPERHSQEGR